MRKMFSASGSARKAARKSATVRRKKPATDERVKAASIEQEIDYRARLAFLHATTGIMNPAPIDTLLDLLPVFSQWFARFRGTERPQLLPAEFGTSVGLTNCRLSCLDDSPEAISLKGTVDAWLKSHRYDDDWVGDYALATLGYHAAGLAVSRHWYSMVDPNETMPLFTLNIRWNRYEESLSRYRNRSMQEFLRRRSQYIRQVQARWGDRKRTHVAKHAKWTALAFAGYTYKEIADQESAAGGRAVGEDAVRKAVKAFVQRAELTRSWARAGPS